MSETDRIEYKETLTSDLEKEVVAFLNASGGNMYIGVKNNGEVIGLSDADGGQVGSQDGGQVSNLTTRQKRTNALKKKEVIVREGATTGQWLIIGKE